DGALDIAIAGGSGIEWIRQGPGGTLTNQGLLGAPSGTQLFLEAADVNGDGATDLVSYSSTGSGTSFVLLTHGAGSTFTATTIPDTNLGGGVLDFNVGDVDSDGRGDLVYSRGSGVRVHLNTAGGWTFTDHPGIVPDPVFLNLSTVAVGDVTGDGRA